MAKRRVLTMDFGASGGRGIIGEYDGNKIKLFEINRFENHPVFAGNTMYWDILRLLHGLKQTLNKSDREGGIDSVTINTWGVDFGLLNEYDELLSNPVHYRDERTNGLMSEAAKRMTLDRLYDITGIQAMEINTLIQLFSLKLQKPNIFNTAKTMLMTPDLLSFFLTGEKTTEYSIATTTQMLDANTRTWSKEVLDAFEIPSSILTEIVSSGTVIGPVTKAITEELSLRNPPKVIAGCGHDTQSAMLATPADEKDFIFISCGTWALFGTELDAPLINEKSKKCNISNEGGYDYKASFLKNIIGTWLIQESRNQWRREGTEYSFGGLEQMAEREKPFLSFVNPDAPEFVPAGNMIKRIAEYCKKTNQEVPLTPGSIVRCINESLAMTYKSALEEISECTGKKYDKIYLVGGGSQSKLLCQMTADATGCEVSAGPVEATVLGNLAIQLIALGELKDMEEARALIKRSSDIQIYKPHNTSDWDAVYERYLKLRR